MTERVNERHIGSIWPEGLTVDEFAEIINAYEKAWPGSTMSNNDTGGYDFWRELRDTELDPDVVEVVVLEDPTAHQLFAHGITSNLRNAVDSKGNPYR